MFQGPGVGFCQEKEQDPKGWGAGEASRRERGLVKGSKGLGGKFLEVAGT